MTMIGSALKLLTQRPSQSMGASLNMTIGSGITGGAVAQMQQYGGSSWLMAVVDRLTSAIAMTEWKLYRGQGGPEITAHPFLERWRQPNPFYSGEEFIETGQQHHELTGETWWLLVSVGRGDWELWPVRPDRMTPIPNKDEYIRGYVYRIGAEVIPLEVDDVIYFKRPNPLDPYRGMSWVQSLLLELGADREAAAYVRNFFRNGAEPGGIIQFDEMLPDADYDKFVTRWREQHQGTANAHRVAVLEGAKWVDRQMSLGREMQFSELRRLNRDTILGAAGVPKSVMGISEDVNRANAEAGEVIFARYCLLPRLRRIRGVVNRRLLPRYGTNLYLDFVDPTPDNREIDLMEATQGYTGGVLTQNEARRRLDEGEVADGDEFKSTPVPPVIAPPSAAPPEEEPEEPEATEAASLRRRLLPDAPEDPEGLLTPAEQRAEAAMQRAWTRRLKAEGARIADFLDQFKSWDRLRLWSDQDRSRATGAGGAVYKVEASDIEGYAWDWWERFGDDVVAELAAAFEVGGVTAEAAVSLPILQSYAAEWARAHSTEFLRLGGDANVVDFTRRRVRELVALAIENGDSLQTLQRTLRNDYAFSRARAETIARTETAQALGSGRMRASLMEGRTEKHWVTQGDDHVDHGAAGGPCRANAAQGWIPIGNAFQSGHMHEPAHARCRCLARARSPQLSDVDPTEGLPGDAPATRGAEVRCPQCRKLLAKATTGSGELHCPRCKAAVIF